MRIYDPDQTARYGHLVVRVYTVISSVYGQAASAYMDIAGADRAVIKHLTAVGMNAVIHTVNDYRTARDIDIIPCFDPLRGICSLARTVAAAGT